MLGAVLLSNDDATNLSGGYYTFMIYIFCDEDKKFIGADVLLRYATVAFDQDHYNRFGKYKIGELYKGGPSIINSIIETLKGTKGFVLMTEARIPEVLISAGEVSTADIPRMASSDFYWSLSMALSIAWLFPILNKHGWSCGTSDVYYDPKSLTEVHRSKILESLQSRLKKQVNQFLKKLGQKGKCNIRRVREVPKPKSGSLLDKFQLGTWLADRLVRNYDRLVEMDGSNVIELRDITEHCLDIKFSKNDNNARQPDEPKGD